MLLCGTSYALSNRGGNRVSFYDSQQRRLPRILVVEDSPTQSMQIVTLLQINRFEVVAAGDGDEGVQAALREQPDCIVLDVVLPKQSGFQVCRKLKHEDTTKHIPIILLSGKTMALDVKWGLRQGAAFYIAKPFEHTDLLAKIRACLVADVPGYGQ